MGTSTELLKLAAELDGLESKVAGDRSQAVARFAKKAIGYLSNAQEEWRTISSFFESGGADKDGMEIEIRQDLHKDAMTVQRHISDALDGAQNVMYGLQGLNE